MAELRLNEEGVQRWINEPRAAYEALIIGLDELIERPTNNGLVNKSALRALRDRVQEER